MNKPISVPAFAALTPLPKGNRRANAGNRARSPRGLLPVLALATAVMAILGVCGADAATFTWDASGLSAGNPTDGAGTWSTTGTNWSNGSSDAGWSNADLTDNAVFGESGTAGTVTVSGGVSVGNITFNPVSSGAYTIAGSTITLTSGTITTNAASATISSQLAGSVGLTTGGTGTLTLGGANTFSGGVTLTSGTISLGNSAALGSGTLTLNGGTITSGNNYTIANPIFAAAGTASILQTIGGANGQVYSGTVTGSGTISNAGSSGNQTFYTGNWSGFAGTLLDTSVASGAWFNNAGSASMILNIAPTSSTAYVNFYDSANGLLNVNIGEISGNSGAEIQTQNNGVAGKVVTLTVGALNLSSTFAGVIADAWDGTHANAKMALTETGTGTLTLTGANTYTGLTTINPGATLQVGNGGSTGSLLSTGTIADNGNLVYNYGGSGSVTVPSGTLISGSGNLSATAGVITLNGNTTLSGSQSYTEAGSAATNHGIGVSGTNVILTGPSISMTGDVGEPTSVGNNTTNLTLNTSSTNGPINLNIALSRSGFYDLLSTFTANAGTGAINWTGANAGNGNQATAINLTGAINFSSNFACQTAQTMTLNTTGSSTVSGNLSGPLALVANGPSTLTLSGANSYTGGTTVNGGTLLLNLSAQSGTLSPGSIAIATSGTLNILSNSNAGADNTLLQNTVLSGSGAIIKTGAGFLSLWSGSGISGFTGNINVLAGTLAFNNVGTSGSAPDVILNIASGATFDDRYNSNVYIDQLTGAGTLNHSYTDSLTFTVGSNNGSSAFSGVIENTGGSFALNKVGAGVLTLSGSNTYNNGTTLTAGGLDINNASALGSNTFTITSGTIDNTSGGAVTLSTYNNAEHWNNSFIFGGSNPLNLGTGAVTLSGDNTVTVAGSTLTVGGAIGGAYNLSVSGAGALVLTGNNTYSGGTVINPGGTLQVGNGGSAGALPSSGNILDNGSLVYNLNSTSSVVPPTTTLSGSGNISVTAGGGGTGSSYADITFNGNMSLGGSMSFIQSGSNAGANGYEGLQVGQGDTPILTASSITMFGDLGYYGGTGGSLTLNTSAYNGPVNLNISLGRANVWYNLSSFTVNSGTGTITVAGTGPQSGGWNSTPVTLTGGMNITGNVNSGASVTLNSTAPGTVSGVLSGGMSLVTGSSGTLTLTGSNIYTGSTTVNGGILQVGNGSTGSVSGSSALSVSGGAMLAFDEANGAGQTQAIADAGTVAGAEGTGITNTLSGIISGTGVFTQSGAGTTTLSGVNTYSNGTTLTAGGLNINNASALGSGAFTINGGTIDNTSGGAITLSAHNNAQNWNGNFTFNGSNPLNLGTGAVTLSGDNTVTVAGSTLTVGGAIGGAYSLAVSGTGALVLTGNSTYSGGSIINPGATLQVGNGGSTGALPSSGGIVDNGNLVYSYNSSTGMNVPTSVSGSGNISATALNLYLNGNVTVGGSQSYIENGGGGFEQGIALAANTTLSGSSITLAGDVGGDGNNSFVLALNTSATNGPINLTNFTVARGGVFYLIGGVTANAGTGTITWTGTSNSDQSVPITLTGGAINISSNFNSSSAQTLTLNPSLASTVSGAFTGAVSLTKGGAGALTISSSSSYTGSTTVSAGRLIVSGSLSGTATPSVAAGATLEVDGLLNNGATATVHGTLTGNGSVGAVNVSGSGSILAPGYNSSLNAAGTLTANGNVTLSSTSTFALRLGVVSGSDNDQLAISSGTASLNGAALQLTLGPAINNPANVGLAYIIINGGAGAGAGEFSFGGNAIANDGTFSTGGLTFEVIYGGTNVGRNTIGNSADDELVLTAVPEPGTWATILLGFGMLVGLQRRRGRSR